MKTVSMILALLLAGTFAHGQFGNILDKAKKKAEEKANQTVDEATKKKTEGTTEENKASDETASGKTDEGKPAGAKVYSKYDFVPGEVILRLEDFSQDAVGDFPDKWNTNASAEIVTVEKQAGHWMMLTRAGYFVPELIDSFPPNFTLEFDLMCDHPVSSWGLQTSFCELQDITKPEDWRSAVNRFTLQLLPGGDGNGSCSYDRRKAGVGEAASNTQTRQLGDAGKPVHVAIWRQKERLRVYLNEEKTWDVPKAILQEAKLNSLVFFVQLIDGSNHFLISNLRLAVGAPDTRNKLLTEGRWITHGILFDVNSATIKPESYGTLKEIANVLKENAAVKVKILGHTDSDGDDQSNMELSKRRAASVREMLAKEFSIEEGRMETDGLGESKPVDKNTTPEGKANNRRVEFVKL